jgi:hypothetical protein
MQYGISGAALPGGLDYGAIVESVCEELDVAPLLVYAIKMNETSPSDPPDIVSPDGGRGIMQLTSSYPLDWADPRSNVAWAVEVFIEPALAYWSSWDSVGGPFSGNDLIRLVAASYNAGLLDAIAWHEAGDVDSGTTRRYGERALANYLQLLAQVESAQGAVLLPGAAARPASIMSSEAEPVGHDGK